MKNKLIKIFSIFSICFALQFISTTDVVAQCPMCRMSAESNLKRGGTMGQGLNNGILYMLSMPYVLVLTLGGFWYYNKRKNREEVS